MIASDPVRLDVERPPVFRRVHVALRLLVLIVISWIAHPLGLVSLGVPVVVAILVSQKGGRRYLDEDGQRATCVLGWLLGVIAYLALLTDDLPGVGGRRATRFEVDRSGEPTVGSALLRILYAIPSMLVLMILGAVGAIVWVVALVLILVNKTYPESLWRFLLGLLRWYARLLTYLASLAEPYPPFSLDTAPASPAAPVS